MAVAVVMAAVIVFAPLATEESVSSDAGTRLERVSLWQSEPGVAVTVAVVLVGLALVPVLFGASRFRRVITFVVAVLLGVLCVLGALSIGVFVAPVFVLVLISAIRG